MDGIRCTARSTAVYIDCVQTCAKMTFFVESRFALKTSARAHKHMQHISKDGCYHVDDPATVTRLTEGRVCHEAPQQRQGLLREPHALPPQPPPRCQARRLAFHWAQFLTPCARSTRAGSLMQCRVVRVAGLIPIGWRSSFGFSRGLSVVVASMRLYSASQTCGTHQWCAQA